MVKKRGISRRYLKKRWKDFLSQDKEGVLHVSNVSVNKLSQKYGTPLYVIIESEIRKRVRRFRDAFPYSRLKMQFASKCNSNLEILKIIREEGGELDASSVGEIILALLADFKPHQITFTNLYKSEQDIRFAAAIGVQAITADSMEELRRMNAVGEKLNQKIKTFIRVNPLVEFGKYSTKKHQYGIPISHVKKAIDYAIDSKFIDLIGFHFHGAYIHSPKIYYIVAEKLLKLAKYCKDKGKVIKSIDLGGGFPSGDNPKAFDPEDFGEDFVSFFKKKSKKLDLPSLNLIFEPGKFIVANAGIGLMQVISSKTVSKRNIIVTNGSTYAFVPDPIIYKCHYEILPADKMVGPRWDYYTIAGCTCDSIDILGHKRWLPKLGEGDLLAIMDCGAYSNVVASNFNTLKRAPMVMINESGQIKLIRRRDRYSEMFAPELDVLKNADPNELMSYYNLFRGVRVDKLWEGSKKEKIVNVIDSKKK
ncbi:diaminopimelate decarboxylase [Nanoarchaeota archaeon]